MVLNFKLRNNTLAARLSLITNLREVKQKRPLIGKLWNEKYRIRYETTPGKYYAVNESVRLITTIDRVEEEQ